MVVEIRPYITHKKKDYSFIESLLQFIPQAEDITEEQLQYFLNEAKQVFFDCMIPDMVKSGIYSSKNNIIQAIENGVLEYEAWINLLVNEDRVIENYPEQEGLIQVGEDDWARLVFHRGIHSIKYVYYYGPEHTARFEVNGDYYFNDLVRRERSDYQPEQKFYKFGDKVRFYHKHETLRKH